MGKKVLVVEDEAEIARLVELHLADLGCEVEVAADGEAALEMARGGGFDLVVLDLMLPGIDGLEVCRRLRSTPELARAPVIMLTARGDEVDRIVGLELGADDYLPKPFNPRELVARVRAIQRRYEPRPASADERIEVAGVVLDPGTREVFSGGKRLDLTTFEFDILEMLLRAAGRVLSRDALMENLYNRKATPFDRSVDMHISHLRRKLEGSGRLIKTIRGVGYQFSRSLEEDPGE